MLTPMDIHNHQFKKSFRGYSENEVDDFLDRVVADFERLIRDNERLKNQAETLNREIEQYRKLEKTLNETLMVAQRTADEVISAAKKNAENLKESTARDCQNIREQAQFEARQRVEGATVKRNEILTDYNRLVREKHEFMLKVRTMLESELAITNQTLNAVPQVEELPTPVQTEPEKISEPEKIIAPEEISEPVEKIPVSVEKVPEPVEKPTPVLDDDAEVNLVDVSTKPVTEDTMVFKPAKKSSSAAKDGAAS